MKDFEKNLVQKIDELSESIDCFEKIVKKAYQNENDCISEDGFYTESQLENVTGKRSFRFAPVFAVICAVCAGTFALTQDNVKEFFYNLSSENQNYSTYSDIKSELDSEIEKYTYSYIDYSFEEYQMNIGCTNPFAYCDNLSTNLENTNIRVYTKVFTVKREKIETNQIYLVHYKDKYTDENIISITDSVAKVNDDDRWEAINEGEENVFKVSWDVIYPKPYSSVIIPENPLDNMTNPFEIGYRNIFKDGEQIYDLYTSTLYWFDNSDTNNDKKHYAMMSCYRKNGEDIVIDTPENQWNETVFQYGDETGFIEETESLFEREYITDKIVNDMTGYNNNVFLEKITDNYSEDTQHTNYYHYNFWSCLRFTNVKLQYYDDITSKFAVIEKHADDYYQTNTDHFVVGEPDVLIGYFDFDTIEKLYESNKVYYDNISNTYDQIEQMEMEKLNQEMEEHHKELQEILTEAENLHIQMEEANIKEAIEEAEKIKQNLAELEAERQLKEKEIEAMEYQSLRLMIIEYLEKNYALNPDNLSSVTSDEYQSDSGVRYFNMQYSMPENKINNVEVRISKGTQYSSDWVVTDVNIVISDKNDDVEIIVDDIITDVFVHTEDERF